MLLFTCVWTLCFYLYIYIYLRCVSLRVDTDTNFSDITETLVARNLIYNIVIKFITFNIKKENAMLPVAMAADFTAKT